MEFEASPNPYRIPNSHHMFSFGEIFVDVGATAGDILGCEKVSIIIEKLKGMEFETHSGTFYKVI